MKYVCDLRDDCQAGEDETNCTVDIKGKPDVHWRRKRKAREEDILPFKTVQKTAKDYCNIPD